MLFYFVLDWINEQEFLFDKRGAKNRQKQPILEDLEFLIFQGADADYKCDDYCPKKYECAKILEGHRKIRQGTKRYAKSVEYNDSFPMGETEF